MTPHHDWDAADDGWLEHPNQSSFPLGVMPTLELGPVKASAPSGPTSPDIATMGELSRARDGEPHDWTWEHWGVPQRSTLEHWRNIQARRREEEAERTAQVPLGLVAVLLFLALPAIADSLFNCSGDTHYRARYLDD